ncbi:hypothetical protein IU448_23010 [Nocardia flavorosea]|uniref:hypothetical protein n=1 Tax=Nocardia flavorosea TaxID=53429 RepID=UPI0018940FFF|nr:hypothetical protein [Nocardia flavorosea]MBF6351862.1 hypothetical protein [Nocardia flavorosea]
MGTPALGLDPRGRLFAAGGAGCVARVYHLPFHRSGALPRHDQVLQLPLKR